MCANRVHGWITGPWPEQGQDQRRDDSWSSYRLISMQRSIDSITGHRRSVLCKPSGTGQSGHRMSQPLVSPLARLRFSFLTLIPRLSLVTKGTDGEFKPVRGISHCQDAKVIMVLLILHIARVFKIVIFSRFKCSLKYILVSSVL